VQVIGLVALARRAGVHELAHQPVIMIDDELLTEAVQCFLDALMASE
jgi:hypothetical protein